jgi:hypothetical protein
MCFAHTVNLSVSYDSQNNDYYPEPVEFCKEGLLSSLSKYDLNYYVLCTLTADPSGRVV